MATRGYPGSVERGGAIGGIPMHWQVSGTTLTIHNPNPSYLLVSVTGSNRSATVRLDTRSNQASGDTYNLFQQPVAAGDVVPLPANYNANLQGAQYMNVRITGAAAMGQFEMVLRDGTIVTLCSTSQFSMLPGGVIRNYNAQIAVPANPYTIQFRCSTGAAALSLRVTMLPVQV